MAWFIGRAAVLTVSVASQLSLASATTIHTSPHAVKERHVVSRDWSFVTRASPDQSLTLQIGIFPDKPGEVERHLDEISNPSHSRFRQYLTADEVNDLVRPSESSIAAVKAWLLDNGISSVDYNFNSGDNLISIPNLNISTVENLLGTSYYVYTDGKRDLLGAEEWSLPLHLHDVIEMVHPTTSFLAMKSSSLTSREEHATDTIGLPESLNDVAENIGSGIDLTLDFDLWHPPSNLTVDQACNISAVTPICLRALYGTLNYEVQAPLKNSMALTNYWGEFNNRSDIRQYLETHRPDAAAAADNFTSFEIAGGINQQEPANSAQLAQGLGREGNMDAQLMLGISYPTRLVTYTMGAVLPPYNPDPFLPENTNEPFLTWLEHIISLPELPGVVSTSYAEPEYTVPQSYARRVCRGVAQLGARGVSVIFGAGDWGVGKPKQCHAAHDPITPRFVPLFPESCPYGTSVAATRNIDPEIVAYNEKSTFVSGGGFSDYFPRPTYQNNAVQSYISQLKGLHDGMYNPNGRAYPDVAAMGYRIVSVWNGTTKAVDGTSASAPIFASIVALVNDALIAEGKPTLGFLNPWLYSDGGGAGAFHDITEGSTRGCNTSGFPATQGWDAASGFGTPRFPMFKSLALQNRFRSSRPWYIEDW